MNIDKKDIQAYYRDIREALPCSYRNKKRILAGLQESVESYLAENPDASFADVQARFGTPDSITNSYAEQLDAGEVIKKLDAKKTVILVACGALLLALVIWAVAVAIALIDESESDNGYIKVDPIIESEEMQ